MRAIAQRISGKLFTENGRAAVLLRDPAAPKDRPDLLYLRYAFVTRGPEDHIFPAFLLDDWGREVRSLSLYAWVRDYGEQFPRGEIFGFEQDGRDTQVFLRELELYARFPLYAVVDRDQPVQEGVLLDAVLLPAEEAAVADETAVARIKRPAELAFPLSNAHVAWWRVPLDLDAFDFSLLDRP